MVKKYKVLNVSLRRATNMVYKVLMNDNVCENFNDYFAINYHAKSTRNRNKLLNLPWVKLEFSKRSFKYMGVMLYNDLPLNVRACENDQNFRKLFNDYVFWTLKLFSTRILIICSRCLFSSYLNFHSSLFYSVLIILCRKCVLNFFIVLGHCL